jgi:hypothetical protein
MMTYTSGQHLSCPSRFFSSALREGFPLTVKPTSIFSKSGEIGLDRVRDEHYHSAAGSYHEKRWIHRKAIRARGAVSS